MIHHWEGLDLDITDYNYHHDATPQGKLYHFKPQILKKVELIKFSDKPTCHTHCKGFDLEITDYHYHHAPTPSGLTIPSQTSNS